MLAMAKYAYNNSKHATTKISPFYGNYGFKLRTKCPTEIPFRNPASELYGHYMSSVHKKLDVRLSESVETMKTHYTKKWKPMELLKKGDLVILNRRNIRAKHRCKKLEDKMLGPFKVSSVGSNLWYCKIKLPDSWKIHPVFNINLLERYKGTNLKKQILEIEADSEDWIMETIIASGPSDGNPKQHVFVVKWKNYTQEENMWKTYENVVGHNMRLLEDYYKYNPAVKRDGRLKKKERKKVSIRKKK